MRPDLGGYRVARFEDSPDIGGDDVLDFWQREGALPSAQDGRDRLSEVGFVALDESDDLVAVSTMFLRRNERLRSEMWHLRVFVGHAHRGSPLAAILVAESRDYLEERFVSHGDRRAPGMLMEIENRDQRRRNDAVWQAEWAPGLRFIFIGENERGDHLRVHWFSGARVP